MTTFETVHTTAMVLNLLQEHFPIGVTIAELQQVCTGQACQTSTEEVEAVAIKLEVLGFIEKDEATETANRFQKAYRGLRSLA